MGAIGRTNDSPAGYNRRQFIADRFNRCFARGDQVFLPAIKRRIPMGVRVILAFFVLASISLFAQTFRGTVLGTVTDASGAVISGAKVAVRNVNTGQERTTETSADGSYSVPELPIGTYTVTITQSGFQTSVTNGVVVDVATERRVDAVLKAGQVSQTVEVSGQELSQIE